MSSNSKKLAASFAALLILLYHCYIPVFRYGSFMGEVERFLIASTYYGVDIFFFLSAYSLVARPVDNYPRFLLNRAVKILPLFIIALIAGQFLWFLPSVMAVYLVLPPLYRVCRKRPTLSFFLLFAGWALLVYLILGVIRPAQDFGIFLFRIPSVILGAYAVGFTERYLTHKPAGIGKNLLPILAGLLLMALGTVLVYRYGYTDKLNVPFRGTFYLTGIPLMLGSVILLDRAAGYIDSRVIRYFGSMTLELYFVQMVLGTWLVSVIFRLTGSRLLTNLAVMAAVILGAAIVNALNKRFTGLFDKRKAP